MESGFNILRSVQGVGHFLKLHHGKQVGMLRLMKLLYIAERECLAEFRLPITSDRPFAMKQGPILSTLHDLLRSRGEAAMQSEWTKFVGVDGTEVFLKEDPGHGKLCKAIRMKIEDVYKRYREVEDEDLIEATHQFPEWRQSWSSEHRADKGSIEFTWDDAMAAQGLSDAEIRRVREDQALKDRLDALAAR